MERQRLAGQVAVVAGATRGAGRGVARMLGEAGATVYCTGRSSRGQARRPGTRAQRPETIEETAEQVSAAGGVGVPVRTDHGEESDVARLFERVRREQGRLDVLVNVLGHDVPMDMKPLTELPYDAGRSAFDGWVWPHVLTCRYAAPLLAASGGLHVEVVEGERISGYRWHLYFDLVLIALKRLAYAMAEELASSGVTALAIAPGFMRTEEVLEHFGATEATWREVARTSAAAKSFGLAGSESPCFVGRAIAALAADPERRRWSGGLQGSWQLAAVYGFDDVDGTRPNWGAYFAQNFPMLEAAPQTGVSWEIVRAPAVDAVAPLQ